DSPCAPEPDNLRRLFLLATVENQGGRRMRVSKFLIALSLMIAGTALAQQTFRIAIGVDADSLDPVQGTTTTIDNIVDYMAQTLMGIDERGALVPQLATEWSTSEDGMSMDVTLRDGVVFHDGTALTADVVVWN